MGGAGGAGRASGGAGWRSGLVGVDAACWRGWLVVHTGVVVPLDVSARRWAVSIAGACALVVLAVALRVHHTQGPLRMDIRGHRLVDARPLGIPVVPLRLASAYDHLGDTTVFAVLVTAAAVSALWLRDRAGAVLAVLGPATTLVLTEVVGKPLVARDEQGAYGFPSGHTAALAALAMVVALVAYRRWGRRGLIATVPGLVLAPGAMVAAVVRLRAHLLSDALAGVVLGFGTVLGSAGLCSVLLARRAWGRGSRRVRRGQPGHHGPSTATPVGGHSAGR